MKTTGLITGLLLSSIRRDSAFISPYAKKAMPKLSPNKAVDIYSPGVSSAIIQSKTNLHKNKKPRIAVIDDFTVRKIDLNGDGEKDIPHGNVVLAVLKAKTDAYISAFTNNKETKILTEFVPEQIDKILKGKENFDAVNISSGFTTSLRILSKKTGIESLNPENLDKHKEQIRKYILETGFNNCDKVIRSIEELTSKGIDVYVAGGNQKSEYVNLFGFARGVKMIGALDESGSTLESSAENSMLEYARGIYKVQDDVDIKGKHHYFLTDDKSFSVELPKPFGISLRKMKEVNHSKNGDVFVRGTSFATPARLAEDLNNKKILK